MRLFIVFFSFNIFLFACQEATTPIEQTEKLNTFFDLEGFFQNEKVRLEKIKSFKKTVSINGTSEVKDLEQLNLDDELSIFIASDINRPAWSDKYKSDSTFTDQNQLANITYQALDEKLKTQKVAIDFEKGIVSKIAIEKITDNAVAQTQQNLVYLVNRGYTVESQQTLSFSDSKIIRVQVEY